MLWSRAQWKNCTKNKSSIKAQTSEIKYEKIDETKIKSLKSAEYLTLLGMDKGTFEKILNILESAFKNLHAPGGRPARLSMFDRLIITIENIHNNRSMTSIAADYAVTKSRISEAIKWVNETLEGNGIPLYKILSRSM